MTEESHDQQSLIRQQFLATFFKKYSSLIEFVNSLPVYAPFKQNAVTRFDEGMFWIREGIVHVQTAIPEEPPKDPIESPPLE